MRRPQVAVSRDVISGAPVEISTSYVERQNLTVRMASRRFTRLTNGFSKKLENHAAAVALYVAHYNLCRVHEALSPDARHQTTPAMALGLTDHPWSIGELIDAALATDEGSPENAPDRRWQFRVIEAGKNKLCDSKILLLRALILSVSFQIDSEGLRWPTRHTILTAALSRQ